jgi:xylulokinase
MTAEKAGDGSTTPAPLWLDVAQAPLVARDVSLPPGSTSRICRAWEGTDQTGNLRKEIAADWAWTRCQWPVVVVTMLQEPRGIGVIAPGDAFLSLGHLGRAVPGDAEVPAEPGQAVHAFCQLPAESLAPDERMIVGGFLRRLGRENSPAPRTRRSCCRKWKSARALDGPEIFLPYLS